MCHRDGGRVTHCNRTATQQRPARTNSPRLSLPSSLLSPLVAQWRHCSACDVIRQFYVVASALGSRLRCFFLPMFHVRVTCCVTCRLHVWRPSSCLLGLHKLATDLICCWSNTVRWFKNSPALVRVVWPLKMWCRKMQKMKQKCAWKARCAIILYCLVLFHELIDLNTLRGT